MRQASPFVGFDDGREMYGVELYREVRLAVVEGAWIRRADTGASIGSTLKKMLDSSVQLSQAAFICAILPA